MMPLGEWILRQACAGAVKWPAHLRVSVNLSAAQFKHGDLLGALKSALDDTGLPQERLALEITETVLLEDNAQNLVLLREIRKLGIDVPVRPHQDRQVVQSEHDAVRHDRVRAPAQSGHSGGCRGGGVARHRVLVRVGLPVQPPGPSRGAGFRNPRSAAAGLRSRLKNACPRGRVSGDAIAGDHAFVDDHAEAGPLRHIHMAVARRNRLLAQGRRLELAIKPLAH